MQISTIFQRRKPVQDLGQETAEETKNEKPISVEKPKIKTKPKEPERLEDWFLTHTINSNS